MCAYPVIREQAFVVSRQVRPPVLVSYAAFVLVGISAGVSGVLLPSQMAGYGVGTNPAAVAELRCALRCVPRASRMDWMTPDQPTVAPFASGRRYLAAVTAP